MTRRKKDLDGMIAQLEAERRDLAETLESRLRAVELQISTARRTFTASLAKARNLLLKLARGVKMAEEWAADAQRRVEQAMPAPSDDDAYDAWRESDEGRRWTDLSSYFENMGTPDASPMEIGFSGSADEEGVLVEIDTPTLELGDLDAPIEKS